MNIFLEFSLIQKTYLFATDFSPLGAIARLSWVACGPVHPSARCWSPAEFKTQRYLPHADRTVPKYNRSCATLPACAARGTTSRGPGLLKLDT